MNLKYMIYLSIIAYYFAEDDCARQGQNNCYWGMELCDDVCDLNIGKCVDSCPIDKATSYECLCGSSSNYCSNGQFCYSNACLSLSTCPNDNQALNKCKCGKNNIICNEGQICKDNACLSLSTCPNENIISNKCICGANNNVCNEGQICKYGDCLFQIKLRKYFCLDLKEEIYLKIKLYNNESINLIKDDKCHWSNTFTFKNNYGLLSFILTKKNIILRESNLKNFNVTELMKLSTGTHEGCEFQGENNTLFLDCNE